MNEIMNHIGELGNPQLLSFILLLISLADVIASCSWRAKKRVSIFSKSLWTGFAIKAFGAGVPYFSSLFFINLDSYFYMLLIIAWTAVFGVANAFSFMANYKLYSKEGYEFILENAPKILQAEIENKINKAQKG